MEKTKSNLARAAMMLLLTIVCTIAQAAGGGGTSNKIVVVSDIHVMAPTLLPAGAETQEAWTNYYAGQRKMLQQSAAIFDQFIDNMISLQPKAVFITGDLTKDGEVVSHEYVRDALDRLRYNDIKVYVIPGNHDFGYEGNYTQFYADGTTAEVEALGYSQFASFYADYGYGQGSELDPNSLSYVAEPIDGLALLAIDSHGATIYDETLEWLTEKAKEKRNAGKQVIAMMHHPLFPHITGANLFIDIYTLENDWEVRNALIDAGVNVILSGHFHTSDIAKDWKDVADKAIYDVNTGSLVSYPCDYRILTPSTDLMSLEVTTASIVPTGMTAAECKTWLQGRTKSIATAKMNEKAGAMAGMVAAQIDDIADFAANLFVLHAEGDENKSAYRGDVEDAYTALKNDQTSNMLLTQGGITDASIYSILDDKSNYGTDKADVTKDRTLTINLPEVGPFKPTEPGTITIGSGESYTDLPLTAQYKYALSQQVFSAEEVNHAKGKIWSIAFRTKNGDLTRKYNVYVTHTDQSSMSSYSWQPVTAADCYFSGEVMFTSGQWNTIYFDKPFEYDGKSNIVVTVDDNTGRADGWGALTNAYFYGDGNHAIARDNSKDIDPLDAESIANASNKGTQIYKNQIQLTFGDYPTPSNFAVTEIGDKSANVQCSLRGEATAWNLRYREVTAEGEEEQRWVAVSDLTVRSFTMEDLNPSTKYEVQVQAVFPEDVLSEWTDAIVFATNCCPVEDQTEIMFALNSYGGNSWCDFAVQIMDVTDKEHPFEVAHLSSPEGRMYGGTLTLCCGHKYQVNWIYDEANKDNNKWLSFALYFEPGDLFYSMARGEAPTETSELTTFVMDCTPYCVQMPQIVNEAGVTYDSATLTFVSQTKTGQVVYSTEEDFDPETATPADVDFEELPQSDVPWEQPNASVTLRGLQPLTTYYVSVRSVCTIEPLSTSRWTPPVKVTTGSSFDAPTQVIAEPVNSHTEKLSWSSLGNEKSHNLYYRNQAVGNPVDPSVIQTFGGGNGTGFGYGSWGDGIWSSYGDRPFSNTIFVSDVPGGSSFRFKAGNGKSGAGQTKILYGKTKKAKDKNARKTMELLDMKCLNDADRAARKKQYELLIWALEEQIKLAKKQLDEGTITQEQYDKEVAENTQKIEKHREDLEMLNALPTDAQKLETMKALEASLASEGLSQEERQSKLAELNELRAITNNAEDPNNDGFAISSKKESNQSRRLSAADDDDTYIFFIRHDDPNGVLLVKDLTITPPEQVGEWTCIPNLTGTEYMLTGLDPNTAYEVMVEPIYEDGTTGLQSPITVFTTLGTETDPIESTFSVSKSKKVQFAKGNLRYKGDSSGYEAEWSMAKQQYEILGEANIDGDSPAYLIDLFCWSTTKNYCGVYSYYYDDDPDANFKGDFVDWGTDAKLASALGTGWSTLTKDEWGYLLTERENAATKKAVATITIDDENTVKGLLLLPDEWTAPTGAPAIDGTPVALTLAQWTTLETAGAVFLPAAGQMTATYNSSSWTTTSTFTKAGTYWTATPSGDKSDMMAMTLSFDDTNATTDTDLNRRTYTAVRLVKAVTTAVDITLYEEGSDNSQIIADNEGKLANVTLSDRTLYKDDSWNTLCLPFDVDLTAEDCPLAGATAKTLADATMTSTTVTLTFGEALTTLAAGVPYIIKWNKGDNIESPTFKGVTIAATVPDASTITKANDNVKFIGYYDAFDIDENDADIYYMTADNKLKHTGVARKLNACRAYFQFTAEAVGGNLQSPTRQLVLDFGDMTTGIKDNSRETISNNGLYDLQGRRITGQTRKGIYIHNGQKIVIR